MLYVILFSYMKSTRNRFHTYQRPSHAAIGSVHNCIRDSNVTAYLFAPSRIFTQIMRNWSRLFHSKEIDLNDTTFWNRGFWTYLIIFCFATTTPAQWRRREPDGRCGHPFCCYYPYKPSSVAICASPDSLHSASWRNPLRRWTVTCVWGIELWSKWHHIKYIKKWSE